MRLIEYEGKTSKLSERDWKRLLKRFDIDRAEYFPRYREYLIRGDCLCSLYSCEDCPLSFGKEAGCLALLRAIITPNRRTFEPGCAIFWTSAKNDQARQQIQKVREALLALPRIK